MAMADKNVNYNDTLQEDTLQDDTTRTDGTHDSHTGITRNPGTEPATGHDVKEGGIMGVVGGAIVGALAGGPIGAVIGAVAGGAASAAAVSVVDKHDHDYDRTVGNNAANDTVGANMTGAYTGTAANSGTITAKSDPYAASTATTGTGYNSNLSQNTGTIDANRETVIPIVEEELEIGKRQVQAGGAHIRTGVTETPVEQSVNLREEHVTVDRHAVNQPVTDGAAAFKEQNFEMTETDEVPVVSKQARVVEEVVIGKTATDRTETVHDTVRRTDVEVDDLKNDNTARR